MNHLSLGMNQVLWSTCLVYLECMITFLKFPYAIFKILFYLWFGYNVSFIKIRCKLSSYYYCIYYGRWFTTDVSRQSQLFSKKNIYFFQRKSLNSNFYLFMFSKKATKNYKIFTVDLTLCSNCQIDGEDFVDFWCLLRKHEL